MLKRFTLNRLVKLIGFAVVLTILAGMTPDRAGAAALRGSTYTSDDFGYSVSWDDAIWSGEAAEDADGVRLSSDLSFGLIQAVGYDGDLADCVSDSTTGLAGEDNVSDFGTASKKLDRPATSRDAEGELFTYLDLDNDEAEMTMYVECRELGIDGTLLQVILLSHEQNYGDAVDTWEAVLDEIAVDESSTSSDRGDDAGDDDSGKSAPERSGLDGDVYVAPEFGFSATWDEDVWTVRELEEDDGMGTGIEVSTEASIGYIAVGNELRGDLEDCAVTYAEGFGEYDAISKMKTASKKFDRPATAEDAVGVLYTFTQATEDDSVKMIGYFECRMLADESAAMILLATMQETYEDEVGAWEDLLAGIEVDGAAKFDDEPSDKSDDKDDSREDNNEEMSNDEASFVGPNFGFSVTVDESVWAINDLSDENNDFLDMQSEFAIGSIIGFDATYDPASCLELLIGLKVGDTALSFDVAPDSMKRPKLTKGATGELFVYSVEGEDGPIELAMYVECRPLAGGDASLGIVLVTVPEAYAAAAPEFTKVLKGVSTGEEA